MRVCVRLYAFLYFFIWNWFKHVHFAISFQAQKKFNTVLSSKRSVIERAFALLKGRFRRLKFLDMNVDEMIPHVIIACTVLHNICLDGIDENDIEDFIHEGREIEIEEAYAENIPNEEAGEVKREYLCALVAEA